MISPDKHWYRLSWLSLLLLPLSVVFRVVAATRRSAYRLGLLRSRDAGVPVIVVGNITAGGTGKTPLVIWLCALLRRHGRHPGIVSRGYGGKGGLQAVTPDTDPAGVGEEPVLLALRAACPVWIGRDRVLAARRLLAANPGCDVIVSDDGLQHYALRRDFEIAVVDGQRGLGNGLPLPSGPLREPASRLRDVDAIVVNGDATAAMPGAHAMVLEGASFRRLDDAGVVRGPDAFRGGAVHAVAGIGNPERFFGHLRRLGLTVIPHPFPDHHAFTPADIDFGDGRAVILTEKDAIKCRRFGRESHWVLAVDANVAPGLGERVLEKLANGSSKN